MYTHLETVIDILDTRLGHRRVNQRHMTTSTTGLTHTHTHTSVIFVTKIKTITRIVVFRELELEL